MKIKPWLFLDYSANPCRMVCQRCGQSEAVNFPMPVSSVSKFAEYFSDRHQFCKETTNQQGAQ